MFFQVFENAHAMCFYHATDKMTRNCLSLIDICFQFLLLWTFCFKYNPSFSPNNHEGMASKFPKFARMKNFRSPLAHFIFQLRTCRFLHWWTSTLGGRLIPIDIYKGNESGILALWPLFCMIYSLFFHTPPRSWCRVSCLLLWIMKKLKVGASIILPVLYLCIPPYYIIQSPSNHVFL